MLQRRALLVTLSAARGPSCRGSVPIARGVRYNSHKPVIQIRNADVYPYGKTEASDALFRNVSLTIKPGEAWVIVSDSNTSRGELFQALLGKRRIQPAPSDGLFPFLHDASKETEGRLYNVVHVSFAKKNVVAGGEFTDYTARYGAVREQDKQTLMENLLESLSQDPPPPPPTEFTKKEEIKEDKAQETHREMITRFAEGLNLLPQLDIPMIALSNGQSRRARILRQLIRQPRLLLLEDPLAGLDVIQRPLLSSLLEQLNSKHDPFILMELRPQDPVPEWITHVAVIEGQEVKVVKRSEYKHEMPPASPIDSPKQSSQEAPSAGQEMVTMNGVRVAYGEREVLRDITWSIRAGDRWWLRGANGSGKTTLLSMLRGEHPQSYVQKDFKLFGTPRSQVPTIVIERKVAAFTPEIFSAFPRRFGPGALTVADSIGTGFEGTYAYRRLTPDQAAKRDEIISKLAPRDTDEAKKKWSKKLFAELPPSEQAFAMMMRTLVSGAPLLILDEVFGGMDDTMIKRGSDYLRNGLSPEQAVVFVTHWEHEVPWPNVKTFNIDGGIGKVVDQ